MKKMHLIPPFVSTVAVLVVTAGVSRAAETTNQPAPGTLHIADTGNDRG